MGKLDYAIKLLEDGLLWDECFINQLKADGVWECYKNWDIEESIESYREAIKILKKENNYNCQ